MTQISALSEARIQVRFNVFVLHSLIQPIGFYTPINYFGRYATCSHKDGGRSRFSLGEPLARRTT